MKTTVENLEKSRVRLHIEVDSAELEQAIQGAYRKVVTKVNLPGFRKGKAPRALLERNFGVEMFYEDAIDILLPKAYSQALEETKIQPVGQPDVDVEKIEKDEGAILLLEVDVFPQVTLGEYTGLAVEKEIETVTEEDILDVLANMQERSSELIVVDSRNEVQQGDFAVIDFTGYIDGEPFSGGAGENHQLEIGSGQFIPGFEEQIIGMQVSEEKDIIVTFPKDYHADSLAGKEATFKVKVKELKEKLLPELDDEFAKDVSEVATLDELKAQVRTDLESAASRRMRNKVEKALVEQIIANSTIDVPQTMIDQQAEYLLNDFSHNLLYQGMNIDYYLQATKSTKEDLLKSFAPEAEVQVKRDLLLDAIADKEGISATEEEINNRIEEIVKDSSQPEKTREIWESRRENLGISLRMEKTMNFLVENAKIKETVVGAPA